MEAFESYLRERIESIDPEENSEATSTFLEVLEAYTGETPYLDLAVIADLNGIAYRYILYIGEENPERIASFDWDEPYPPHGWAHLSLKDGSDPFPKES